MKITLRWCLIFSFSLFVQSVPTTQRRIDSSENDPFRTKYLIYKNTKGRFCVENLLKKRTKADPTTSDVTFRLTNHNNIEAYETLHCDNFAEIVSSAVYDPNLINYFIIHGWSNSADSSVNIIVRRSVLEYTNANVFVVDWSGPASNDYTDAQSAVPIIGKFVGEYINQMINQFGLSASDFRIVGHSLGAHVSGCAGAAVNGNVHYIIGLDPAGPLFTLEQTDNRLDETDGNFVQVIHTNTGLLSFASSIGHADYYPNGGEWQPGCGIDLTGACAHGRAFEFLGESIISSGFIATNCENYEDYQSGKCNGNPTAYMGEFEIDTTASGDFYLNTHDLPPYAIN